MKIPPADEDRKEFVNIVFDYHKHLFKAIYNKGLTEKEREKMIEVGINEMWGKIESKRKEWIEYGYKQAPKIKNLVKCVGFAEEPNFECDKVLPIEEMQSTVREPNKFYCEECYQRGVRMEEEAMGPYD